MTEADKKNHTLNVLLRFLGRTSEELQSAHYFSLIASINEDTDPGMRAIAKHVEDALANTKEDVEYLKKKYVELLQEKA